MKWDGKRIRDLRRKMSWSPADLARRLNCNYKSILDWEIDRASPSQTQVEMLDKFEEQRADSVTGLEKQARAETIMKDHGLDQVSHNEFDEIEE